MSTATAEKPAAEVVLPPAGDMPTPKQKEDFLKFVGGKNFKSKEQVTEPVKEVVEVAKQEPAKTEPVKEAAKAETKTEPVAKEEVPPKTDAEKNFAALRQKAEAAEKAHAEAMAEIAKFKSEMEELRKKPAPEEFIKEFEKTKAERAEYQKRLREADLARDPEFNAKYDNAIKSAMIEMVNVAVGSGVDRKEATAAVSAWNEGQFAEWLGGMSEIDKLKFGANLQRAVTLYQEKEGEIANADQAYQKLQQQREEQAKQQMEQRQSGLNADIEANLKELAETPLGKDHTDLLTETRTLLRRAGGLEGERIDNKTLLGMVGKSLLLARGFERQEKALAEKAEKITELEKTLAERDAFIKELNDSTPPVNGSLPAKKVTGKDAARAILNPVIAK